MRVRNLLSEKPRDVITATPATTVDEAMEMLIRHNIGCLPVVDETGKLVGIVSDKDIFKKVHETKGNYHSLTVNDIMTAELVIGLLDDELTEVAGIMDEKWIRHVPILDGEQIVGIISQRDIISTQAKHMEFENRYLNLYMDSLHRRDKSGD
jgi:CBS domain-containing protein